MPLFILQIIHYLLLLNTTDNHMLLQLPEPFSFIFTWFAAVPLIVYLATSLTKLILKDFLILKVEI